MNNKNNATERNLLSESEFIALVSSHFDGWKKKVERDFKKSSFERELKGLSSDAVYPKYGLDSPEYVLIRLMGRMSISIGRRLGEIYDKLPRQIVCEKFGLEKSQVAEKFDGLELDIGIRYKHLSSHNAQHVQELVLGYGGDGNERGIGIEIRYNFNPNDSARLRKDKQMAKLLKRAGLFPLYLIFSGISPRNDAIAGLKRCGWQFLQGDDASRFAEQLLGIDFLAVLGKEAVRKQVLQNARSLMTSIYSSYAFRHVVNQQGLGH